MEQQAQDRIHRLGQYKPIHVTRFIIGGTIEERILKLQVCAAPLLFSLSSSKMHIFNCLAGCQAPHISSVVPRQVDDQWLCECRRRSGWFLRAQWGATQRRLGG